MPKTKATVYAQKHGIEDKNSLYQTGHAAGYIYYVSIGQVEKFSFLHKQHMEYQKGFVDGYTKAKKGMWLTNLHGAKQRKIPFCSVFLMFFVLK